MKKIYPSKKAKRRAEFHEREAKRGKKKEHQERFFNIPVGEIEEMAAAMGIRLE